MKINYIQYFFIICFLMACNETEEANTILGNTPTLDCSVLTTSLLDLNEDSLQSILNPELENFNFLDQDNNACLHDNNLREFVSLLNDNCENLTASIECACCPEISQISIQIDSTGISVSRILDLLTPNENGATLSFLGIHN